MYHSEEAEVIAASYIITQHHAPLLADLPVAPGLPPRHNVQADTSSQN